MPSEAERHVSIRTVTMDVRMYQPFPKVASSLSRSSKVDQYLVVSLDFGSANCDRYLLHGGDARSPLAQI
ncbi:hypothetical protein ACTMU2_17880 [Cupriavidus basilensis]